MGIPVGALKVALSGTLPGGEIWQTGFWYFGLTLTSAEMASTATDVYNVFNQSSGTHFMPAWRAAIGNPTTSWTTVTLYNYQDTSGKATTTGQKIGAAYNGGSATQHPDQMALCITLRTALSGARHRGRMYMPATGAGLDSNALMQTSGLQPVLDGLVADFHALSGTPHLSGFMPVVLSKVLGQTFAITSVTADLRPDIQRRRANRQNRGTSLFSTV